MLPVGEASAATDMLERIRLAGGYPDLAAFLAGASLAYEQIVGAFADGELQPVVGLLGPAVRQAFTEAIAERRSRGETLSATVIGLKAEPVAAGLDSGTAWIEVRFATEMVSATVDREGRVLAGDPRRVVELSEAWTFARDVRSTDPNWMLVATDEDA